MPRQKKDWTRKKMSLTISVPFKLWKYKQEKGNKKMCEIIELGLWAKKLNINQFTLAALKEEYERKISKLQEVIEAREQEVIG